MKLYVFGNGFDIAHELNTRYSDYRKYIKNNVDRYPKWEIILDLFPDEYEFWSDIEYYFCKFDAESYNNYKRIFDAGLLDELYRQIEDSFYRFILFDIQSKVALINKPLFNINKNSIFLTFNYTTTLEDVYFIPSSSIIHIHNDIRGLIMKLIFGINNNPQPIIGHSPLETDFFQHKGIIKDKEYFDYVSKSTKHCSDIINNKKIDKFISNNISSIDEIVFYGFSFSITDKEYVKLIFRLFENKNIKISIFYKKSAGQANSDCILELKRKIKQCGVNELNAAFIDCDSTIDL